MHADGKRVETIFKDGEPVPGSIRLELPSQVPQTYFLAALKHLSEMAPDAHWSDLRTSGVQGFLMALIGLEAFVNIYFSQIAREKRLHEALDMIAKRTSTMESKVAHLPRRVFGTSLPDQTTLTRKVRQLYDLRTRLVHPRVEHSSMNMGGFTLSGIIDNFHRPLEDPVFVRETLVWCLLVIARIGIHAQDGKSDLFVKFWTGANDNNATLSDFLKVSAIPGELKA